MHELEAVFGCRVDPVVAAAVQSWSLLLSITPFSRVPPLQARYIMYVYIAEGYTPYSSRMILYSNIHVCAHTHVHMRTHTHSMLPVLNGLLRTGDMSVRIAVGQAVALLFELAQGRTDDDCDAHVRQYYNGGGAMNDSTCIHWRHIYTL